MIEDQDDINNELKRGLVELRQEITALRREVGQLHAQLGTTGMRLGPRVETSLEIEARTQQLVDAVTKAKPLPNASVEAPATIPEQRDIEGGPALCTTNGQTVAEVRANQKNETGQHAGYIVLCPDERAKGFTRPYRDAYRHVGRLVNIVLNEEDMKDACIPRSHRINGCGTVTTMGKALSETYARDPKFYGSTFCCHCQKHLPVSEFIWTRDGLEVGS